MKRLAIIGASGHGKVVGDIAESCGWETIEFFDDASPKSSRTGGWLVVGNINDFLLSSSSYDGVVVAIGNNQVRSNICCELLMQGNKLVTLIHPAAVVSPRAQIGIGSVVMAGAVINTSSVIGCGAIINTNASVDHDCFLADYVHVSPGANLAGGVTIGKESWIGIGANVKQKITIGARVTVGAGAAVVENIPDFLTVAGIPARPLLVK